MAELDLGLPPMLKKGARKRVTKKFHATKNLPVDVAVRRQVAIEIGEDEPTKDQKFILLQKYGATNPRIDRLVTKPNWMGVPEWKRKQNDWFQATKGLVRPEQRSRFSRNQPNSTSSRPQLANSRNVPQSPTTQRQQPSSTPRFPRNSSPKWNPNQQARRPDTKA